MASSDHPEFDALFATRQSWSTDQWMDEVEKRLNSAVAKHNSKAIASAGVQLHALTHRLLDERPDIKTNPRFILALKRIITEVFGVEVKDHD